MNPRLPLELINQIQAKAFICGSDECGYGAWAGPLVACAVVTSRDWTLPGVTDSKKISKKKREALYPVLIKLPHGVEFVSAEDIDSMGLAAAWEKAHSGAIQKALNAASDQLNGDPPLVVVDGSKRLKGAIALPKADLLIPTVSAASIIGKVTRDRWMTEEGKKYPQYCFDKSSGYGTKKHQTALHQYGPIRGLHRFSYSSIKRLP